MSLLKKLEKSLDVWFVIIFLILFFFLRLPSLIEPYWYGDEGIYQTIGIVLNQGGLLYRDVWDNKPPLLYFFYSFLDSDQFNLRMISLIFGAFGVVSFFMLSKKLLTKPAVYRTVSGVFALFFGLPLIEGNIANAENFIIPLVVFSAYLLTKHLSGKKREPLVIFSVGFILGMAFLIKIVALFDFLAFLIILLIVNSPKKINADSLKNHLRNKAGDVLLFVLGFIIPFLFTIFYFYINGSLLLYINSMFFSNIDYVGWGNRLSIPLSLLHVKIMILGLSLFIIFLKRKTIVFPAFIFILIWFAFSLFNTFFSQRPYPHYMLTLLPSYCLLLGSIFLYGKVKNQLLLIFLVSSIVVFNYFSLFSTRSIEKNVNYYANFLDYSLGQKDTNSYRAFFDRNTPRDYLIADFIEMNSMKEDGIFVWGNNAQLYKLTGKTPPGKYTTLYHIVQYPDGIANTKLGLKKMNPKFIILVSENPAFPFSLYNYRERINIQGAKIYERII